LHTLHFPVPTDLLRERVDEALKSLCSKLPAVDARFVSGDVLLSAPSQEALSHAQLLLDTLLGQQARTAHCGRRSFPP